MQKLRITMPSVRDVLLTREFDARRSLVFDALTKPEWINKWYGQKGWALTACEVDLRVGGKWRFVLKDPGGREVGQVGTYQEIVSPERIVNTESWEDWDAGETLVTTTLTENGTKTVFSSRIMFPSQEVRDIVIKNGLEHGAGEIYDRLEEVLMARAANRN